MKTKLAALGISVLLSYAPAALADKAVLAGGCFWCVEADFEKLDGVSEAVSGFTGGTLENPTYSGNHAGHYEAVEITYDSQKVSYKKLLDYYWHHIDPFDPAGQFCDKGHTYQSAIFVANATERKIAEETKAEVEKQFPQEKVATKILPAGKFYPIAGNESYHQNYYKNNPTRYKFYRWNCGRDQRVEQIWGKVNK